MKIWITCVLGSFLVTGSFSVKAQTKASFSFSDTTTSVIILAKFVKQTKVPCCCSIRLREKNMFETIVSFRNKQLAKRIIEVEYTKACRPQGFLKDSLYNIIAVKNPFSLNEDYINVYTQLENPIQVSLEKSPSPTVPGIFIKYDCSGTTNSLKV